MRILCRVEDAIVVATSQVSISDEVAQILLRIRARRCAAKISGASEAFGAKNDA